MAAWIDSLRAEWERQDERAKNGATPCCGGRDFVVIYREGDRAKVMCRRCRIDSIVRV